MSQNSRLRMEIVHANLIRRNMHVEVFLVSSESASMKDHHATWWPQWKYCEILTCIFLHGVHWIQRCTGCSVGFNGLFWPRKHKALITALRGLLFALRGRIKPLNDMFAPRVGVVFIYRVKTQNVKPKKCSLAFQFIVNFVDSLERFNLISVLSGKLGKYFLYFKENKIVSSGVSLPNMLWEKKVLIPGRRRGCPGWPEFCMPSILELNDQTLIVSTVIYRRTAKGSQCSTFEFLTVWDAYALNNCTRDFKSQVAAKIMTASAPARMPLWVWASDAAFMTKLIESTLEHVANPSSFTLWIAENRIELWTSFSV